MWNTDIKRLAYELDPLCWVSYSGLEPQEKRGIDWRRTASLQWAESMTAVDPEQAQARITCMCGEYMKDHGYTSGHSPVSMWDHKQSQPTESNAMLNYSKAVFLINDQVRAIKCTYVGDDGPAAAKAGIEPGYVFKTLDKSIKKDDIVMVPTDTRVKFTCVKVTEVDVGVDYDSNDFQMKWIVGKLDKERYDEILAQEQTAIEAIKAAEDQRRREELRKSLFSSAMQDGKLKNLAITHLASEGTPETPPIQPAAPQTRVTPSDPE